MGIMCFFVLQNDQDKGIGEESMKIALVGNSDHCIYNYRKELIEALLENGCEVFVLSPDGARVKEMIDMGCTYFETPMKPHGTNPIGDFKLMLLYKKLLKKISPDYVFTYTIKPNIYASIACRQLKIPSIANITGLGTAVENGGIMQKISCALYKFGLKGCQKVFFQNEENKNFMLQRGMVSGAYEVLPGSGVNLKRFHVLDYPDGDEIHFSFIARVMKEKGIDQYLDAARYFKKKYPNMYFHICGLCEQHYEDELKALQEQGIVVYHGMVSDIAEIHKFCSCTVLPTYYPEGLCNVLLESLACGRPIITTDRAGCREVVEDGVNGFVVKQQDSNDLIEKIERFVSMSREEQMQLGLNGRRKIEQEFDRKIVEKRYFGELGIKTEFLVS